MAYGIVIGSKNDDIDEEIANNIEDLIDYAIEHNSFNIEIEVEKAAGYSEKYDEYYSERLYNIEIDLRDYIDCNDFLDYVHMKCKEECK